MRQWLNKNKWLIIWALLSVIAALVVHLLFQKPAPNVFLQAKWSPGDILTYFSTISLGLLAMWQNQKSLREQKDQFEFSVKPQIQCYLSCYKTRNGTPYLVLVTENVGSLIARNISLQITWPEGMKLSAFVSEASELNRTAFSLAPRARLSTPIAWNKARKQVLDGKIQISGTYKYISSKGKEICDQIVPFELTCDEFDLFNAINSEGGYNDGQAENAHSE